VQRHHGPGDRQRGVRGRASSASSGTQGAAGPVRHRAGLRQEDPLRGRAQPLQARVLRRGPDRRRGDRQEQHPAHRSHRLGQDALGPDSGPHSQGALRHRRRHHPDRGGLCGRGCGEHPGPAPAERGLRHRVRLPGHHLHRRDRQDRAQGRQPVHHPRRVRRGRAAGPAEDHRGHRGQHPAQGGAQASPAGIHPHEHGQHPVHRGRSLHWSGEDRAAADARVSGMGSGAKVEVKRKDLARERTAFPGPAHGPDQVRA
jgi:hypothetical protein